MSEMLIIARHAHAADAAGGRKDIDRKLTLQGIESAGKAAAWLKTQQILPDLIVASPAERTRNTAGIYAQALNYPTKMVLAENYLYRATATEIIENLRQASPSHKIIMFVGHNPAVSDLAELLSSREIKYLAPAGLAIFKLTQPGWENLRETKQLLLNSLNAEKS